MKAWRPPVSLITAASLVTLLTLRLSFTTWVDTWALFGEYPTQAEVHRATLCAGAAALLAPTPFWLCAWRTRHRAFVAVALFQTIALVWWTGFVWSGVDSTG